MLVSFDLWNTLIKSNPDFREMRHDYVREFFKKDLGDSYIDHAFDSVKNTLNSVIEQTGWQPTTEQILRMLFSNFGITYDNFNKLHAALFHKQYQELAIQIPPLVYSEETLPALRDLVQAGRTIKISSNTMFITGETLKKILFNADIKYASFHCFSDQVGYAKPDVRMYSTSSVHVGDNILTDVDGPRKLGIKSFLINTNDKTISDAVEFILQ